jgi:Bacterial Ig-like domain (group 3)
MNLLTRSTRAVGAIAAAALGLTIVAVAPAAQAAEIGSLTFTSLTTQDSAFSVTTSAGCPSPATNFQVKVAGGNVPVDAGNIVGNTAGSTIGTGIASAFTVPVSNTLRVFATNNGLTQLDDGTYTVTLVCRALLQSATLGDYVGTFTVSNSGATVTPQVPVVKADTSTTLAVAATSGWGQQLALSATVSNTTNPSGAKPTGTVAFTEGSTVLATANVNANGVAATTYGLLGLGAHTLTAVYTPGATDAFKASTSAGASVTISLAAPTLLSPASLSGTVKVGARVVCLPGVWSGATQYTYEFLKNGVVAQTSTTDSDVVLAAADAGKTLSCRVTGSNPIGDGGPSTTAATKVALGSAAVAAKAPRITFSGSAANVGETLKAFKGVWSPAATYTYTYVWKRGTTVVKQGATATTYKATAKDKGKKLTLTVQVKRTGYATAVKTSAAVTVK